jgi:hypothetical protein
MADTLAAFGNFLANCEKKSRNYPSLNNAKLADASSRKYKNVPLPHFIFDA